MGSWPTKELTPYLTPKWTRYIPWKPNSAPQTAFLLLDDRVCDEALYGGAAGGGKSVALLMAALQWVDVPGYSAILFRRTYQDLAQPGCLLPMSHEWLGKSDAKFDQKNFTWRFPSGAVVTFGYMDSENDKFRYQGSEYQYIGWDELTQFTQSQYEYMFSRLRRTTDIRAPLRVRAASNPGGLGHMWVKRRFVDPEYRKPRAVYIPAKYTDNPAIDQQQYEVALNHLDPITRARYKAGDWTVMEAGNMFRREMFQVVARDEVPVNLLKVVAWDLAATKQDEDKKNDPDYTCGVVMGKAADDTMYLLDIIRCRMSPGDVEAVVASVAKTYGGDVDYWMEEEPGSSGKATVDHYKRNILRDYIFRGEKTTGSKADRARPLSAAASAGKIKVVRGQWLNDWFDEIEVFPGGPHDDQVDAASLAFVKLVQKKWGMTEGGLGYGERRHEMSDPRTDDSRFGDSPWDAVRVSNPYHWGV